MRVERQGLTTFDPGGALQIHPAMRLSNVFQRFLKDLVSARCHVSQQCIQRTPYSVNNWARGAQLMSLGQDCDASSMCGQLVLSLAAAGAQPDARTRHVPLGPRP